MTTKKQEKIKFSKAFWVANTVELFERAAYYGVFIVITLYLSRILGFNDIQAASIAGIFSACLYLLPTFAGALADKIGFRNSMLLAFTLLTCGYLGLAVYPTWLQSAGLVEYSTTTTFTGLLESNLQYGIIPIMALIVCGGAFIKSVISGKSAQHSGEGKTFGQIWNALIKVCSNGRLITLIIIITGFWMVQHQLYATMPKYVLRLAGEGASPSWYANVNPLVVVLTVNLVTQMMRKRTALTSMTVGMFIMPVSALCMASGNMLDTNSLILGMHPVAFMMVVGIVFQGLAETFISPRFLEYFSLQAPKGEEGLYLGFSHLHSFLSSIFGFGLSGFLLSKYCPEPTLFASHEEWLAASANAHYIWYYFGAIALVSAVALIVYGQVVKRLDSQKI